MAARRRAALLGRRSPFADDHERLIAGRFGMWLFLGALAVLFGASVMGFIVIRIQLAQQEAWPEDLPLLPRALWLSTLLLVLSSVTMQWAVGCVRSDHRERLVAAMGLTLGLGLGFLLVQAWGGWTWLEALGRRWGDSDSYRFALSGFYVLTGLHALHVVGGLIPMAAVTRGAVRRVYAPRTRASVEYCALYWHFLDCVWLVLFGSLLLGV